MPWYKLKFSHEDVGQMERWHKELYANLSRGDEQAT